MFVLIKHDTRAIKGACRLSVTLTVKNKDDRDLIVWGCSFFIKSRKCSSDISMFCVSVSDLEKCFAQQ